MNNKKLVAATDVFDHRNYPDITKELIIFKKSTPVLPHSYRATILISFIKDYMIRSDLVRTYPEVIRYITLQQAAIKHLENLFQSCHANVSFQKDLEIYIIQQLE